jgi:diguanylate cyclase (GGDEF)-like protein
LVDLDSFTELNARFGQDACDKFLQSTARTLDRVMRDVDFLARIGGDEFAVLLPETSRTGGAIVAERTRAAIEAIRMDVKDQIVGLSATVVGVSLEDLPASAGQDEMHGAATRQLRRLHNRGGNRASWVDGTGARS